MRLWVAIHHSNDHDEILGIFSTTEKAHEYKEKFQHQSWNIDTEEYELDKPNESWPYE